MYIVIFFYSNGVPYVDATPLFTRVRILFRCSNNISLISCSLKFLHNINILERMCYRLTSPSVFLFRSWVWDVTLLFSVDDGWSLGDYSLQGVHLENIIHYFRLSIHHWWRERVCRPHVSVADACGLILARWEILFTPLWSDSTCVYARVYSTLLVK